MTTKLAVTFFVASLMACAPPAPAGGGDDDGPGPGPGPGSPDAGMTSGHMVLSGTTVEQGQSGSTALGGVAIAAYITGVATPLAMATSDAQGKYSLTIDGGALDGYFKITKSGYKDTYLYPAKPWSGDATVQASMLSTSTFGLLVTFAGGDSSKGVIIAQILDASGNPVSGAKISSTPSSGLYKYSDGTGAPTQTTQTSADGTAFFMNVPGSAVTITAMKTGATFHAHAVTAPAGALVTTVITE